ncbi:MAG TPA: FAD-binding oxidoreductase [Candidatus Baltobacteraceae bacterium]|jgi:glycine/D-amino acid oxidase-like deaminating enzyme
MTLRVGIIGGGVIGSSIAYFLSADPAFDGSVAVVEKDSTYEIASSALSVSSIRQQFSSDINIKISQFGIEFLRNLSDYLGTEDNRPDVGLVERGYLYLVADSGLQTLRQNYEVQRQNGVDVALLDVNVLRERFPWIATDGLALGSLGLSGEGWFDGYLLLQSFRKKAMAQGVEYVSGNVVDIGVVGERARSVHLSDGTQCDFDVVVNAAGPWAATIADMLDTPLPVRARRRCVYHFSSAEETPNCPLVIDKSGVWFRPEGNGIVCGFTPEPEDDLDGMELRVDHKAFENFVWPTLAERVPSFDTIRVLRSWAGYYEMNTFDQTGIVGRHPALTNVYFANGFSGHGLQQSPAVGRGVAELIAHGTYQTLDLTPLSYERILRNEPLLELNVI